MSMNPYGNLLENQIAAADPVGLVEMLYRAAVNAVSAARASVRSGEIRARSQYISKALGIINELARELNHEKGGEISRSLAELYDYCARKLHQANFEQSEPPLKEVEEILSTLLSAWEQCRPRADTDQVPDGGREYQRLSCIA